VVFPWQEIIDAGDLVVWKAGKRVGEPGLRIDAIQLGGLDQGIGDGGGTASSLRADEQIILPPDCDPPHRAFRSVVIQLQNAVVEIWPEPLHAGQGVADRNGQRRLAAVIADHDICLEPSVG